MLAKTAMNMRKEKVAPNVYELLKSLSPLTIVGKRAPPIDPPLHHLIKLQWSKKARAEMFERVIVGDISVCK